MEKIQSTPEYIRIRDITPGSNIHSLFLIGSVSRQQARNGPFWRLDLKDAYACIEARIWAPLSLQYADIPSGSIADVEGRAEKFRETLQINVTSLYLLTPEETATLDISRLIPTSERPVQEMYAELLSLCRKEFTHKPWRAFIFSILEDKTIRPALMAAPAAKSLHHAWTGGLLEHTLSVATLCMRLCDHYPMLDRQILLAGAVCHDLGKLRELSSEHGTEYTDKGWLIGHIILGLELLERPLAQSGLEPDLVMHFKHLILSHHGQYIYASPRIPQTAEAFALHYADNLDARLAQTRVLFADLAAEEAKWSPYQRSLERAMYHAPRTPTDDEDEDIR